jgi:hypothetical protein
MADAAQPSRPGLAALYLAKLTASRGSGLEHDLTDVGRPMSTTMRQRPGAGQCCGQPWAGLSDNNRQLEVAP